MSQLLLTHHAQFHRAIRIENLPLSLRMGKFFLFFSMTFLIGLISFFYLIKFTEIHTKGYQLRRLELEKNRLMSHRNEKTMGIAEMRSLKSIRESEAAKRMVPARSAIFIREDGGIAQVSLKTF